MFCYLQDFNVKNSLLNFQQYLFPGCAGFFLFKGTASIAHSL